MGTKYLLGATTDNEIVFAEFGVRTWNGYPEFSASFSCVRPFIGKNTNLEDYFEDYTRETMGDTWFLNQLETYDCSPSELKYKLAEDCYDVRDVIDCSLFPEEYRIDKNDWYFESSSCGQCDTRRDMKEYVNKKAYDHLMLLWDMYHLKKVPMCIEKAVDMLKSELYSVDEEEWITDFIRREVW